MTELKACPFCGGTDIWEVSETVVDYDPNPAVRCNECDVQVTGDTVSEAITKWNRRRYRLEDMPRAPADGLPELEPLL